LITQKITNDTPNVLFRKHEEIVNFLCLKNHGFLKRTKTRRPSLVLRAYSLPSVEFISNPKTLKFCLQHRCIKNQVLQVFGRIEQEFNASETLQVSPPKSASPASLNRVR